MEDKIMEKVCTKANSILGKDSNQIRQDRCGLSITRDEYGNKNSDLGWKVDHQNPDKGEDLSNLDPLQWENNVRKSDGSLNCGCSGGTADHV